MESGRERMQRMGKSRWFVRYFRQPACAARLTADVVAMLVAVGAALFLRNVDGDVAYIAADVAIFTTCFLVTFLTVGVGEGLYRGRARYGSFDEIASLARTGTVTTMVAVVVARQADTLVPLSVALLAGVLALVAMAGVRYAWRLVAERTLHPSGDDVRRVLVIGGGEGGHQLISAMRRDPDGCYLPVGIIDDDVMKRRLRISGVPVVGTRSDLAAVAERLTADAAVIAIPSATADLIRELTRLTRLAGLKALVLPPVRELLDQRVEVDDLRPPTEADLLGRHEVQIDTEGIAGYITGRRVLVTGAGGSIGSELCRQLDRFAPERLVMLDRDESALHAVQLSIEGRAMLDSPNLVVADIRDRERILEVFEQHRPLVVFHAAALKHLPLLELHPAEGFKTNVVGTQHVLDAAAAAGVERFINISTDKAADPTSILGYTKRMAERLTAAAAGSTGRSYVSVRFGNVLGSRGSVLTTFRAQVLAGGPITVTHPDVTRYFMTVEEAVQLVIQAGAVGTSGEALVLDMGEPVRIADVARHLADASARPVEVVFTGLRPGEKLHEVLHATDERPRPSAHPLITAVDVPPLDFATVSTSQGARDELVT